MPKLIGPANKDVKNLFLYFLTFADLFAVGLVVPYISAHVTSLEGSHFVAGLMGSFYSGLQLFSSPLVGSFSDVKGRKPVLLTTLLVCSIIYLLFGIVSSIYLLLVFRIGLGIFKHTQTLSKAVVSDLVRHEDQSDVYGKMAAVSGMGIALGPTIGGHIMEDYPENGFAMLCSITSILFIINAGVIQYISKSKKEHHKPHSSRQSVSYMDILADGWKKSLQELKDVEWHKYWDVFLLKGLISFSMGIFYSNYSPLLKHEFGLSPKWIGYTISFQGVIGAVCSFFIKYINTKFYKKDFKYTERNFHCFVGVTVTFLLIILCNTWYVFALLLIPLAMGNAILRIVGLEILVHKSPANQRGSLIGASNSVRSISGTLAPSIAGYIGDRLGLKYVMIVSLVTSFLGVIITLFYKIFHDKQKVQAKKKK